MMLVATTAIATNPKEQALRSLNRLPPFSPVLNRLMATLAREDVSFAKVADLLEKDTVLSGNILALVNSAVYGRRGRVNSVRHAVSLLGVAKLKNAALSMSITRLWNSIKTPPGWSMADFNQHSIATAMLSDMLCQLAPITYPEGAFVGGLLHDLGKLLLAVGLPDVHEEIINLSLRKQQSRLSSEMEVLGFTHADLSGEGLRAWNLPEPIQLAVCYHHQIDKDPSPRPNGDFPLSYVISAANGYVTQMGLPAQKGDIASEPKRDIFESLKISGEVSRVLDEFHAEFEGIKGFF